MIKADFHVHTTFCDGTSSPEEYVEEALKRGMTSLGFSVHAYTPFDESFCIQKNAMKDYITAIRRLKDAYRGKLRILCGAEVDGYGKRPDEALDYIIGSLHYVRKNGRYYPVDESLEALNNAINEAWEGDALAFAEDYYREVTRIEALSPDIIGHIDLLTKFNEQKTLFDETDKRYLAAAKGAIDALLPLGVPFEVNTGAIFRGYRQTPYPAEELLAYILSKGGKVLLSSDAHHASGLMYCFDEWEEKLKKADASAFETI